MVLFSFRLVVVWMVVVWLEWLLLMLVLLVKNGLLVCSVMIGVVVGGNVVVKLMVVCRVIVVGWVCMVVIGSLNWYGVLEVFRVGLVYIMWVVLVLLGDVL